MSTETIKAYWAFCDSRDWAAFAELLTEQVVYEIPQTRERISGRAAYLQFNAEYPGDWRIEVHRVVAEDRHGASWIRFLLDGGAVPAVTFFDFDREGRITHITDFWPEPYSPPPGREHLVERY